MKPLTVLIVSWSLFLGSLSFASTYKCFIEKSKVSQNSLFSKSSTQNSSCGTVTIDSSATYKAGEINPGYTDKCGGILVIAKDVGTSKLTTTLSLLEKGEAVDWSSRRSVAESIVALSTSDHISQFQMVLQLDSSKPGYLQDMEYGANCFQQ